MLDRMAPAIAPPEASKYSEAQIAFAAKPAEDGTRSALPSPSPRPGIISGKCQPKRSDSKGARQDELKPELDAVRRRRYLVTNSQKLGGAVGIGELSYVS
jgi:hypothetical protein